MANLAKSEFRNYLPQAGKDANSQDSTDDIIKYTEKAFEKVPMVQELYKNWQMLWNQPFRGITNDGITKSGLYHAHDDDIDTASVVEAASNILRLLSPEEQASVVFPIAAPERRIWSNPEFYVFRYGIRLEQVGQDIVSAVEALMERTLSGEGFLKAKAAMRMNHFLGQVVNQPRICNELSYNFLMFGTPSTTEPFGWLLYGHHLCISAFIQANQIVISPTFTGAEPNLIDEGPFKGTRILHSEQDLGLKLMQSLPTCQQRMARIFKTLGPPEIPVDRWNPADQRHLCGAFQDNRIVPYEGLCFANASERYRDLLLQLIEQFVIYLPEQARKNRMAEVRIHLDETHFCWIGNYDDASPFYYRIQSPVIICEFDHHSGIFLTNKEPARFHIHTIVRSPNGGDYGYALLAERSAKDVGEASNGT